MSNNATTALQLNNAPRDVISAVIMRDSIIDQAQKSGRFTTETQNRIDDLNRLIKLRGYGNNG